MILYFADREMNILGMASTGGTKGLLISDDELTEDVETASETLQFDLHYTSDNAASVIPMAQVGHYVLRSGTTQGFYTITTTENNSSERYIEVYCESAGLDLLNEEASAFAATEAHPIAWYIDKYIYDTGFERGINEDPSSMRTLTWDGSDTAAKRLQSVATEFGDEIYYSFDIRGLDVAHKYINVRKQRGRNIGKTIVGGRDFDNLTIKMSIEDLATALIVSGGTPDSSDGSTSSPITLSGMKYDDKDIYVDGTMLKSRTALSEWSRYISRDESGSDVGHIVKLWSYDTTSQTELLNRAISHLKKVRNPEVNYELELTHLDDDVQIGDTLRISDKLTDTYATARVLKIVTSEASRTRKATLGSFLMAY